MSPICLLHIHEVTTLCLALGSELEAPHLFFLLSWSSRKCNLWWKVELETMVRDAKGSFQQPSEYHNGKIYPRFNHESYSSIIVSLVVISPLFILKRVFF